MTSFDAASRAELLVVLASSMVFSFVGVVDRLAREIWGGCVDPVGEGEDEAADETLEAAVDVGTPANAPAVS